MRIQRTTGIVLLAAGLVVLAGRDGRAQTCHGGDPVIAKPVAGGGTNQFAFQLPDPPATGAPSLAASWHWFLVDDFVEESASASISSGFINTSTSGSKSELYIVRNAAQEGLGETFSSCTIRAHMLVNGTGSTTAYLVVKQGATQSDGSAITVTGNYTQEYQRVMTTNPITGVAWVSDDIGLGITVGVKNDAGVNGIGVGIGDIVLECS